MRQEEMHEMAIAEGILDIAQQTAIANNAKIVRRITMQIGEMAGVEIEALRFAFSSLVIGTIAEGAEIEVEWVPLIGKCLDCSYEFPVEDYRFVCPCCESTLVQTKSGRELKVASIDIE